MATKYVVKPGDTLNSIASQYGFSNYKEAGITSVPSGNFDLIRPGDTIDIGGSSTPVSGYKATTPLVTSLDSQAQFSKDSAELDKMMNPTYLPDDPTTTSDKANDPNKTDATKTESIKTGDAYYDTLRANTDASKAKYEAEAADVLKEYDSLYKIELAAIDAKTKASISAIKSSFEQRIQEQVRINKVNVDRVKAYGLGGGAAQYLPIMWSDAITERERQGAKEISDLERQRQDLIDKAKAAKEEGNAALLSQRIKDYNDTKEKLNKRLSEIEAESQKQYELLRKVREDQEAEYQKKKGESLKRLQAYYKLNPEEVSNLSSEEKQALINTISTKYGLEPFEVLGAIEAATAPDYEALQAEADLAKTKAQTAASYASAGSSNASAAAAYALAAQRKKQTDQIGTENENTYSQTDKNKLRQAGLSDAPQNVKDDFLYGDLGVDEQSVQDYLNGKGGGDGLSDEEAYQEYLKASGQ